MIRIYSLLYNIHSKQIEVSQDCEFIQIISNIIQSLENLDIRY